MQELKPIYGTLFSIPFILIGLLIFVGTVKTIGTMYTHTRDWIEIDAEVVEIRTKYEMNTGRRKMSNSSKIRHYPLLQYEVEGETYKYLGDKSIAEESASPSSTPPIVYKPQSDDPVYLKILYDPANPNNAVMKYTGWDWFGNLAISMGFGLLLLGPGVLVFVLSFKYKSRKHRD